MHDQYNITLPNRLAKKELIVTWNTGRQGEALPSLPFSALMGWWEE
jgi:hypothetical protein